MPQHDRPPKRKNIVVTDGALNLINDSYLKEQSQRLLSSVFFKGLPAKHCLGLLIGGDTKGFLLGKDTILETARQIKSICEKFNFDLLVTTSRRTSREVENIVKEEFKNYDRCKLLIIANENNIAEAVGGILGLSSIVIVSAESISMISEAASSKKYVLVFDSGGLNKKHRRLLNHFARNKYIYLTEPHNLSGKIEDIWLNKPQVNVLKDAFLVKEAIKKIL
jgi:mitochondrial fission protein ELM1